MSDMQKIGAAIIVVFVGLVLSEVTAFPLFHELNIMATIMVGGSGDFTPEHDTGVTKWQWK